MDFKGSVKELLSFGGKGPLFKRRSIGLMDWQVQVIIQEPTWGEFQHVFWVWCVARRQEYFIHLNPIFNAHSYIFTFLYGWYQELMKCLVYMVVHVFLTHMFIPTWANDPNLLGIFCQMGWFNHQPHNSTTWHGRWWMRFEVWEVMGRTWRKFWWIFFHQEIIWMFPKIVGFPPKSSIVMGFPLFSPSILGYHYFWKHLYIWKVYNTVLLMLQKSQGQPTVWMVLNTLLNTGIYLPTSTGYIAGFLPPATIFPPEKKLNQLLNPRRV